MAYKTLKMQTKVSNTPKLGEVLVFFRNLLPIIVPPTLTISLNAKDQIRWLVWRGHWAMYTYILYM